MSNTLLIVAIFLPLLFVLWVANMADRARERAARLQAAGDPDPVRLAPAALAVPVAPGPDAPVEAYAPAPAGEHAPTAQAAAPNDSGPILAGVAYGVLILLYLGLIGIGIVMQLIGLLARGPAGAQLAEAVRASGMNVDQLAGMLPRLGAAFWIPAVVGIILLLRPVRRLVAHAVPIDPASTVHAIALSYIALIVVNMATTLVVLPLVAGMVEDQALQGQAGSTISSVWAQELLMALMAVIGVGWLARRGWRQVLSRLCVVRPTWAQVGIGIGGGLLMIPLVLAIQALAGALHIGMDANVEKLSNALIGPLTESALGIVTIGAAAALGEEAVFRGALHPRFGLLLTAILFALLHSQDGLSLATLVVLVIGLVLGLLRDRTNTSTTMVMHAVYNSSLGLLAYLNVLK